MPQNDNKSRYWTVVGNLVKDPEAKLVDGRQVVELQVAHNPERYNAETRRHESTGDPVYYQVSVWGKPGEHCLKSLHKGNRVMVAGRLTETPYIKGNGEQAVNRAIVASEVAASLTFTAITVAPSQGLGASI